MRWSARPAAVCTDSCWNWWHWYNTSGQRCVRFHYTGMPSSLHEWWWRWRCRVTLYHVAVLFTANRLLMPDAFINCKLTLRYEMLIPVCSSDFCAVYVTNFKVFWRARTVLKRKRKSRTKSAAGLAESRPCNRIVRVYDGGRLRTVYLCVCLVSVEQTA